MVDALRQHVPEDGFYFIPGMDERARKTEAGRKEWEQRYAAGPTGLLIYHPHGEQPVTARLLGVELLTDVVAVMIAAWAAAQARGFTRRVLVVTCFGLAGWMAIEASYWNWYGFPAAYEVAQLVDQVVGFALAGLAVAWIVRPVKPAA